MVSSWCRHPHHSTDILPPTDTKDGSRPDPETSLYFMAMQQLSEDHRAVVTMFDIQGMPHAEISKILGVSEGTVRSRLFYAHRHLQTFLDDFRK